MKVTLQEYNEDKVAAGLSPIKSVLGTRKLTMGTKPLAGAIGGTSGKINPLANGMIPSGATNKGGSMLKMAMSGEGYDKEAFLGGLIAKTVGKGMARMGSKLGISGMKNKGMGMMDAHAKRVAAANTAQKSLQATGSMGLVGHIGNAMARNSTGWGRKAGLNMMKNRQNYNIRTSLDNQKIKSLSESMKAKVNPNAGFTPGGAVNPRQTEAGTIYRNNGVPRKTVLKKAQAGKFNWSANPGSARAGATGNPITTKAKPKKNTTLDGAHVELGSPEALKQQNTYLKKKIKSDKERGKGGGDKGGGDKGGGDKGGGDKGGGDKGGGDKGGGDKGGGDKGGGDKGGGDKGGGSKIEKGLLEKSTDFVRKNPLTSIAGAGVIGHMVNNNSGSPVVVNN